MHLLGIGQAVGNAKVFGDTIHNYTRNDYRRVDLTGHLSQEVVPGRAIALLKDGIVRIPNVLPIPAPVIEIFEFTLAGPLLVVRPSAPTSTTGKAYFDTNRMIRKIFGPGFPAPEIITSHTGAWKMAEHGL